MSARRRLGPERGLLAVALCALAAACATPAALPPPPGVDPGRLARLRAEEPELADEVTLLEWQAARAAERGDALGAERYARLARILVARSRTPSPPARCPATETSTVASPQPEADAAQARTAKASADKRRRRRRPRPPAARAEAETQPTLEELMQARAEVIRGLEAVDLGPDGRVWLDAAQRALIDAQRSVAAGARERARQQLSRVDEALAAIGGGETDPVTTAGSSSVSRSLGPLEAFARDLTAAEVRPVVNEGWLVVPIPSSRRADRVTKRQRGSLETLGRLLRVYASARLCVRGPDDRRGRVDEQAAVIRSHLERVEKIEVRRFVPCSPRLSEDAGGLFVGLTFSRRRS